MAPPPPKTGNDSYPSDFCFPTPLMTYLGDRYVCCRLLEYRPRSSVWLVKNPMPAHPEDEFCWAEIFTRTATEESRAGVLNEVTLRRDIKAQRLRVSGFARMIDEGEIDGPNGPHCFMIYNGVGETIEAACFASPTRTLKPYLAKHVINKALGALCELHARDIVHTEVNEATMQREAVTRGDVVADLTAHPPQIIGEVIVNGATQIEYVPQPVSCSWPLWSNDQLLGELERHRLELVSVKRVGQRIPFVALSTPGLVAPEVIIGCKLTTKYDLWGVGCLAFKLLLGEDLFNPVSVEGKWTLEEDLLAQIYETTGEKFSPSTLDGAERKDEFLDIEGNLLIKRDPRVSSLEERIVSYKTLPDDEATELAQFLQECLRIDPTKRTGTEELASGKWSFGWMYE